MKKLTQIRLKELLDYNKFTGDLTWKVNKGRAKVGDKINTVSSSGYVQAKIDGKLYTAHRLAWLYTYGYFPEYYVDHVNHIKTDNRIINLREVSPYCNSQNMANNTSGYPGVSYIKRDCRWIVRHTIDGKRKHIGSFKSRQDAIVVKEICKTEDQRCFTEQTTKP